MFLDAFRARIEELRSRICVLRITKKHPWGHAPDLMAIRFFDWAAAKKLRKEIIESYEDYLEHEAKLTVKGKWVQDAIVPFAMVAAGPALDPKEWPDSEVLSDAFALLFFDAARQTETGCPVLMATTDPFKLKVIAPSLETLGVICVGREWSPTAMVVLDG